MFLLTLISKIYYYIFHIMKKLPFDNNKYLTIQRENILKRISRFGDKLYLEFGGKLFDDMHASRVLPGFKPDSKLQMLLGIKDKAEVIIVVNANDINSNKVRADIGITYQEDVLRLNQQARYRYGLLHKRVTDFGEDNEPLKAEEFKEKR